LIKVLFLLCSPWRRVGLYMVPTVLFSIAFNLPKFFEFLVEWKPNQEEIGRDPETNETIYRNASDVLTIKATDLRQV
jgi:hypothetical protein